MEARQLHSFLAVAETLNVGRATDRLDLSQPAPSRQIQRLERELGVVFERQSRWIGLTSADRTLAVHAQRAVNTGPGEIGGILLDAELGFALG